MSYSFSEMQSVASNMFSAYASVAASMMLYRSMANDMIPEPVKNFFYNTLGQYIMLLVRRFFPPREQSHMTIIVDEQTGIYRNQIYEAAEIYLRPKINPKTDRLKANKSQKQKSISISMEKEEKVFDQFNGFEVRWQYVLIEADGDKNKYQRQPDKRYFEVTFEMKHKDTVVNEYLPMILKKAKEFKDNDRSVKLFTRDCYLDDDDDEGGNGNGTWGCVNFDHPVTFEKLAMDPKKKKEILDDLDRFVRRKEYYKKVGKAWKRGYLLYGPPGTGKSSMIAAIANYLKFDVYDLELSSLYSNSDLKRVLLATNNRSIIVIEDIDCTAQTHNRDASDDSSSDDSYSDNKLTLSGLLNFMDGLWSTCGDERIVIFTTNHKDKLDPALLRPGRMDMHIHMGYCTPEGFDVLASNYLEVHDHERLFPEIKQLIKEVDVTPAEIAEHLMRNEDRELALEGVLGLLKQKQEVKAAMVVAEEKGREKVSERSENVESEVKEKKQKKFGGFLRSLTRSRRVTSKEDKK